MNFIDPRERYEDLLVRRGEEELDTDAFADTANSEPATVGWVVLGFVFDQENRVLLINQEGWTDGQNPEEQRTGRTAPRSSSERSTRRNRRGKHCGQAPRSQRVHGHS